jgi:hypothetical protein
MIRYCTECGKKLQLVRAYTDTKTLYDALTGQPHVETKDIEIYQCPDYKSGYSDRFWSVHDSVMFVNGDRKTEANYYD